MEAIVVKAVARELALGLPARVHAVLQPSPREIVLVLRGAAERRLIVSTEPTSPRLHLVGARPAQLPAPTAFCRLLRKRLEGRVLVAVECPGVERVVTLSFAAPRGGAPDLRLVAELMGKHSNLVLVEVAGGLVVDSLQHVEPPMSRVRTVLPGLPYEPPPAGDRLDLGALDAAAFSAIWNETGGAPAGLFARVLGVGPGMLALALGQARATPGFAADPGAAVHAALRECRGRVERGEYRPVFYPERDLLLTDPVPGWEAEPRRDAPTMNDAAEQYFAERAARRETARRRDERARELRRALKKARADEALRRGEILEAEQASFLQAAGTALTLAAGGVAKGAETFTAPDPATGEPRAVRLDPRLGARQNAEALFKRARKLRRRGALAAGKLPALEAGRRALEEELALVPTLPLDELAGAAAGARGAGRGRPAAAPDPRLAGIREYRSPEGWRILVGKSGAGNDRLTGRVAAPEDYWLHVRGFPGAHVVLKGAGADPPEAAIAAAAAIAAWHSGARAEQAVDVSYTRRKSVRKVKGGAPGAVVLGQESTVRVRPMIPAGVEERAT
jgi:predicted ribosome quality control (RQC) complex YloA/Tae2 family protein